MTGSFLFFFFRYVGFCVLTHSSTPYDRTAVGRTSTFSAALTRTIVTILLAGLLPGVKADCRIDWYAP